MKDDYAYKKLVVYTKAVDFVAHVLICSRISRKRSNTPFATNSAGQQFQFHQILPKEWGVCLLKREHILWRSHTVRY